MCEIGINVRGTNLDEDTRLVLLVGSLPQVLKCFDLISEIIFTLQQQPVTPSSLYNSAIPNTQSSMFEPPSILYMLLEHSKVVS